MTDERPLDLKHYNRNQCSIASCSAFGWHGYGEMSWTDMSVLGCVRLVTDRLRFLLMKGGEIKFTPISMSLATAT